MDIAKTVLDTLEMPGDILFNMPKIQIVGGMLAQIENYTALVEYRKEDIKLKYKGGIIEICGQNFEIKTIGEGNIVICGKIQAVKFI